MYFAARTAGAGVAHHPEIVFLAAGNDMQVRVETGSGKQPRPMVVSFLVELGRVTGAGFIDGRVNAMGRKLPNSSHQFPSPLDGFFFEVITETPVPQHLKERVVIGVETNVVEVVVLAAGANALLGVGGAGGQAGDGAGSFIDVGL